MINTFLQYWVTLFQHEFRGQRFSGRSYCRCGNSDHGLLCGTTCPVLCREALADIGFAGATGAAVLGISSLVGMFIMTLLAALGMGALGERIRGRDVEIGMVLSFALGLGVLFLSIYTQNGANATVGVGVLFGSILSVTRTDVLVSLITALVTLLVLALLFRPLLFASIDPVVAQARGIPVRLLSIVFLLLLAFATAEAVLVIGVLRSFHY